MLGCHHLSPREVTSSVATDLTHRVCDALRKTGYSPLENVLIAVDGQTVYLQGHLPSYYLRQLAQHVAKSVPGVEQVVDQIDVVRSR